MVKQFKSESGAATILEYTVVLPIVITVVLSMIFVGYIMYQRALMEAAAMRVVLYSSKTAANPNYETFVTRDGEQNEIAAIHIKIDQVKNDPYRHIFHEKGTNQEAENWLSDYFSRNHLFFDTKPTIAVKRQGNQIIAELGALYSIPVVWLDFGLPMFELKVKQIAYISDPAELMRNTDFAIDLVETVIGQVQGGGVFQKVIELANVIKNNLSLFGNSER